MPDPRSRKRLSARAVSMEASQAVHAPPHVEAGPMETVEVNLGTRTYPIYIGAGLLQKGALLRQHIAGSSALVVTNDTVAKEYLEPTLAALHGGDSGIRVEHVVLPDGEQYKSIEVLQRVWDKALQSRLDRNTTFVALGGGVIGDMTGFAAAAYQRGVAFVQIPTTVMAQVDSSVGGKTGVNHPLGKNMIGAFHQPQCVLIDTKALDTLPARELASGISEIIKYGLIRDAELFEWLEANMPRLLARDPQAWTHAIRRSCENKAEVVAADEREGGVRATLNLGHTFGHAIEAAAGYGAWLHGEAVAAGTVMAADLSRRLGWIDAALEGRTTALIAAAGLPTRPPKGMTPEVFMGFMGVDKKVVDGTLRLILLKGPLGGCVITSEFDAAELRATLEEFCDGA
ncbi:DHQS1 [Auxenochlorella protothecoides x Auxenochlorella symbiontica]